MSAASSPQSNHLLAALPESALQRWLPELEIVDMPLGSVLYESGGALSHVYFPTTAIVSLLYVMEDGASAEIAVVGNEGIVGISLFMGGQSTPSRAVVQSAGKGFRLTAPLMKAEFDRAGSVLHLLLRYTQALITQMAQTAVCNRHHSLDQQLCRWLLLSLDRLEGNQLVMTQELIANMLGVRREGVTEGKSLAQLSHDRLEFSHTLPGAAEFAQALALPRFGLLEASEGAASRCATRRLRWSTRSSWRGLKVPDASVGAKDSFQSFNW